MVQWTSLYAIFITGKLELHQGFNKKGMWSKFKTYA